MRALNETAPRWERLRTRSSTHGVNNSRPSPAGARPGSTPRLNQRGPPCSSPAWPPGPRQGWAAGFDSLFWLAIGRYFSQNAPLTQPFNLYKANAVPIAASFKGIVSGGPIPPGTRPMHAQPTGYNLLPYAGSGGLLTLLCARRSPSPRPSAHHLETHCGPNGRVWRHSPNETNSQRQQSGSKGGQDQLSSMPEPAPRELAHEMPNQSNLEKETINYGPPADGSRGRERKPTSRDWGAG